MKPADLTWGLPPAEQLRGYRIWDSYFTPAHGHPGKDGFSTTLADMTRSERAIALGHIEKLCLFSHVGIGTTGDAAAEELLRARPELVLKPFEQWPDKLIGMIQLNSNDVPASLAAIDRWLGDGPMIGVYFPGGGPGALACSDPRLMPLIEAVIARKGVIMQHTWNKTGGKQAPGESTPAELAVVAARYPDQVFLCAHAGGEWEQGIRAVRDTPNVWIETSGFDATAGFIEMAVRELGEDRLLFGSHLPSRSLGTELTKVTAAAISEEAKRKILGGNFRRLLGA
ncbi:MAG: amidohydrolase family protein [Verrucomicrobiales bacterium]|nr:amidohydrolase family protein [Verrucomicrobiales bacterium]